MPRLSVGPVGRGPRRGEPYELVAVARVQCRTERMEYGAGGGWGSCSGGLAFDVVRRPDRPHGPVVVSRLGTDLGHAPAPVGLALVRVAAVVDDARLRGGDGTAPDAETGVPELGTTAAGRSRSLGRDGGSQAPKRFGEMIRCQGASIEVCSGSRVAELSEGIRGRLPRPHPPVHHRLPHRLPGGAHRVRPRGDRIGERGRSLLRLLALAALGALPGTFLAGPVGLADGPTGAYVSFVVAVGAVVGVACWALDRARPGLGPIAGVAVVAAMLVVDVVAGAPCSSTAPSATRSRSPAASLAWGTSRTPSSGRRR